MQVTGRGGEPEVSISSPSSEGGGFEPSPRLDNVTVTFPLVLLQAKVVGLRTIDSKSCTPTVSISSPSSEGGG